MPHSKIHNKKRLKNYAVLALLLLFVALIWAMAMIKLAHASGMPDRFSSQRQKHQEKIEADQQEWWYGKNAGIAAKNARAAQKGRAQGMDEDELNALAADNKLQTLLDDSQETPQETKPENSNDAKEQTEQTEQ